MQRIYISGSIGYDEIMNFPNHFKDYFHPEKLHQINVSFAVDSLAKHLGGCSTNIAYALRQAIDHLNVISTPFDKLRASSVEKSQSLRSLDSKKQLKAARDDKYTISPIGAVGKDGEQLIEFFKSNNIDTSNILQDKKLYTATGKVITDQNDNQIWGFYYGASSLNIQINKYSNEEIKKTSKNNKEFWVLSATHERPFTTALKHVIKNKLPYLFDPGMTLTWIRDDLLKKGVLNATYLIGNDYEIAMIEKRLKMTVSEIVKKGVNVIVTLGEKGVRYYGSTDSDSALLPANAPLQHKSARVSGMPLRPSHLFRHDIVKAIKLRKVVDPTGAGDAWRGGFVGALISGKEIRECLVMGNVMASFAVETVGTVEYVAKREEIEKRVKNISK
jgi:adenosine kinase